MSEKFEIERSKIPEVVLTDTWKLKDSPNAEEAIYQVGEWSLSKWDDPEPQDALNAIYSWIAWYEHLTKK